MQLWTEVFQNLFLANTGGWSNTLRAWDELFKAQGRSNDEMIHVVMAIAGSSSIPKFPVDFLRSIQAELRHRDEDHKRAREEDRQTYLVRCEECQDSGWVSGLPHLDTVEGPVWNAPHWTMAVLCICPKGQRFNAFYSTRQDRPLNIINLHEYHKRNPHWRAQWEVRRAQAEAERAAHVQQHGPFHWEKTVRAILARYGNQITPPEVGKQIAGGHLLTHLGGAEIQTDEHGEIQEDLPF